MEPRFGHDFARVRVHNDGKAAESARAVNALAYTVGQDVVFGAGQYVPGTMAGRKLLAHELAHTLQQGEAPSASQEALIVSAPGDAAEWQADQIARLVSRQGPQESAPHPLFVPPTAPHLARQPAGGKAQPFTVEEQIRVELERQIAADDDEAIQQRRQRLRELFQSIPPSEARNLHDRLRKGMEGDEFARFFHLRLATATREEMLGILQQKSVEAEATRLREAEKKIEDDLKIAREAHARATAMLDAVASGLDPDLVEQVRAQGESVQETIELLAESKSFLAAMPEDKRRITMGAGSIELQAYIHSAGHLTVLEKIVSFELPDAVTNQDEAEEKLDEYANWHEEWIGANEDIGTLAADIVNFNLGLEEQIAINQIIGQYFTEINEQGQALNAVDEHVDAIIAEAKDIKERAEKRSTIETVVEVILTIRGRGRRLRRPPKVRGGPKPKASKRSAKKRKQFKKPKDATKQQKPKERRKKKDRKKEQRAKAYPICWATQLGPPLPRGAPVPFFVRTPGVERDTNDAKQRRMQLWYREKVDPDFRAAGYHVHHIVPLFLGGLDAAAMNLTIIPARLHLKGHRVLAHQPQMAKPPRGLKPLPTNLYNHPAGTIYRLKGFKTEANQTC